MPLDESAASMCINVGIANHDGQNLSFWVYSFAYEHVRLCVMLCCHPYFQHAARNTQKNPLDPKILIDSKSYQFSPVRSQGIFRVILGFTLIRKEFLRNTQQNSYLVCLMFSNKGGSKVEHYQVLRTHVQLVIAYCTCAPSGYRFFALHIFCTWWDFGKHVVYSQSDSPNYCFCPVSCVGINDSQRICCLVHKREKC